MVKERFTKEVGRSGFSIDKTMTQEVRFLREEKNGSRSSLCYYEILPGIDIVYNSIRSGSGSETQYKNDGKKVIELNFCLEGCFQCQVNGKAFSLSEGEIEAHLWGIPKKDAQFINNEYRGVSLLIDPEGIGRKLHEMFPKFNSHLNTLMEGIKRNDGIIRIKSSSAIIRAFQEIYKIDPVTQQYFLQLKVLEVLGLIQTMPISSTIEKVYYSYKDIDKVKAIHQRVAAEPEKHYSLSELATEYSIGKTTLQKCFKEIYGKSYYSYFKHLRMRQALNYLEEGKLSIVEIAGKLGYGNPSKFAAAFRSVYGVAPRDFKIINL
ncbi:AraC-family transcriptional regulator [Anaerovibrio sp. JC8]|uniref:helix-turn-helix domain-containing protein n=1 Tax=Anaerovibrio sp. JC8 TaxID=1240085 RepID=UPI000A0C6833|nr:AraC family transcriptional regulator [Anaerovibrio sp. JC8]ORT99668.1 AraC-family transcriptional regulator [Anaerovibrio sp. JC8]